MRATLFLIFLSRCLVASSVSVTSSATPTPSATATPLAYYQSVQTQNDYDLSGKLLGRGINFSTPGVSLNYAYSTDGSTVYMKVVTATAANWSAIMGNCCTPISVTVYATAETAMYQSMKVNQGTPLSTVMAINRAKGIK